jgi:ketosteroid isomerase-like protein
MFRNRRNSFTPMADVFTLDDGHIVELRLYVDRRVALESAGIGG